MKSVVLLSCLLYMSYRRAHIVGVKEINEMQEIFKSYRFFNIRLGHAAVCVLISISAD